LHMPLGTGTVDVTRTVCALQKCGYDGTITLEVFTSDPRYVTYSRDRLRATWNECAAGQMRDYQTVQA
jgi:sugar phosphate isomerase/epimerase